jgi:hypothetical protein
VVRRDDDGFILTGPATGANSLLETTVPGVFAVGEVRSGSTKRCATAVGEGAWAVQLSTPISRHAEHPMTERRECTRRRSDSAYVSDRANSSP